MASAAELKATINPSIGVRPVRPAAPEAVTVRVVPIDETSNVPFSENSTGGGTEATGGASTITSNEASETPSS